MTEPTYCGTCKRPLSPDEPRHREPGWDMGDVDCADCYATWPVRARAALDAKKGGAR